jgi:hypothetical protein
MPYTIRPVELPLDVEECRTAIWRCRGNISKAAELIKVPSARLRKFVAKSPFLTEEVKEASEQLVDLAEDIVHEALTDAGDAGRRDTMARFVLTGIGKSRGHGSAGAGVSINLPKGPINISWGDGTSVVNEQKTIEHQ